MIIIREIETLLHQLVEVRGDLLPMNALADHKVHKRLSLDYNYIAAFISAKSFIWFITIWLCCAEPLPDFIDFFCRKLWSPDQMLFRIAVSVEIMEPQ
ncbi:hypothetical protein D1872_236210 [compost metagenome]